MEISKAISILLTGGTGSFGREFIRSVLSKLPTISRLVIYSRDELKQYEMSQIYSEVDYPGLRYFIGDIQDKDRLARTLDGFEIVIHAAALKQVGLLAD